MHYWTSNCACWSGRQLIRGNPSKTFQPFLLPGDMKGNLEELKNKLMVNFDPLRYFVTDIEASSKTRLFCTFVDGLIPMYSNLFSLTSYGQKEFPDMFKVWYDSFGGDAIGLTCSHKISKVKVVPDFKRLWTISSTFFFS